MEYVTIGEIDSIYIRKTFSKSCYNISFILYYNFIHSFLGMLYRVINRHCGNDSHNMDRRRILMVPMWILHIIATATLLFSMDVGIQAFAKGPVASTAPEFYNHKATWAETMIASRAGYTRWYNQLPAQIGPWYMSNVKATGLPDRLQRVLRHKPGSHRRFVRTWATGQQIRYGNFHNGLSSWY